MVDTTQTQINDQVAASKQAATLLVQQQMMSLNTMAPLRAKMLDGTATDADKASFFKEKQKYDQLEQQLIATGQLNSDDVQKIKKEQLQKKLSKLKGAQGSLNFANPGDLFEFILRTEALNPYSRERTCDIEFLDLLSKVAVETNTDIKKIEDLKTLVRDSVSAN